MEQPSAWFPSWSSEPGAQPTQPADTFRTAFAATIDDEDPDEWEYEYSTSETETYYVTLDLSAPVPQHKTIADPAARRTTRWGNPAIGRHKAPNAPVPPTFAAKSSSTDPNVINSMQDLEINEEASHTSPHIEKPRAPPAVQILDLHSRNPIVSYDGHVYSCKWASNIGTELLFTAAEGNPHPYLRTVPGDVDILAASSARIISQNVEVQPKAEPQQWAQKSRTKKSGHSIPIGPGASARRKEQAGFLEKLMAVKDKKGEEDMVTIHAQKRLLKTGWRAEIMEKRKQERAVLIRAIERNQDGEGDAARRLAEMDREDKERREEDKSKAVSRRRRGARKPGRPSKRTRELGEDNLPSPAKYLKVSRGKGREHLARNLNEDELTSSEDGDLDMSDDEEAEGINASDGEMDGFGPENDNEYMRG